VILYALILKIDASKRLWICAPCECDGAVNVADGFTLHVVWFGAAVVQSKHFAYFLCSKHLCITDGTVFSDISAP
jgi:hypothetical protein